MKHILHIEEVPKAYATDFVQALHYSKVMPKLTKHYLGCFLENELVGVVTLGWGTQPKGTINKLFDGLNTDDYYEIGKMCMADHMPRNSESQMLSAVVRWLKEYCPEKQYLYTWADGIMGKPGYVYQAANFLYGGFIETEIYILPNGEKVHPRSSKRLLTENAAFKSERDPEFFKDRKRIYHLTTDFLDCKKIRHIKGRQFRYIFPLSKGARNRLKKSKVEWNLLYPKGKNLVWKERSMHGTEILNEMPHIDGSMTAYNSRNVNAHLRVQQ